MQVDMVLVRKTLLDDPAFLLAVKEKIVEMTPGSKSVMLEGLIQDLTELIKGIIRNHVEMFVNPIVEQNQRFLNQLKTSMELNRSRQSDSSFTEVKRVFTDDRFKTDNILGSDPNQSLSLNLEQPADEFETDERLDDIKERLRRIEDKYETNFKSIWNVLSITEASFNSHILSCSEGRKVPTSPTPKTAHGKGEQSPSRELFRSMKFW